MNDIHPGKYVDSSGQKNILGTRGQVNQRRESLIEQHGRDRENIFVMEQSAMNDLAAVLERIKKLEDTVSVIIYINDVQLADGCAKIAQQTL
jgi:hypothetical protein